MTKSKQLTEVEERVKKVKYPKIEAILKKQIKVACDAKPEDDFEYYYDELEHEVAKTIQSTQDKVRSEERSKFGENIYDVFKKADEMMKKSNGHFFEKILKTRCVYCGRSPKVKTKCGSWFQTFLKHVQFVLLNPEELTPSIKG